MVERAFQPSQNCGIVEDVDLERSTCLGKRQPCGVEKDRYKIEHGWRQAYKVVGMVADGFEFLIRNVDIVLQEWVLLKARVYQNLPSSLRPYRSHPPVLLPCAHFRPLPFIFSALSTLTLSEYSKNAHIALDISSTWKNLFPHSFLLVFQDLQVPDTA